MVNLYLGICWLRCFLRHWRSSSGQQQRGGFQSLLDYALHSKMANTLMWSHLKYYMQFSAPQYIKDIKKLKSIQRRARKMVKGLGDKPYEVTCPVQPGEGDRGNLIAVCNFLARQSGGTGTHLLSLGISDRI